MSNSVILRRLVKFALFGLAALVTLIALAYAGIDFWGRSQWDHAKKELQKQGEPLSVSELLPPEIPDRDNFYATKFWRDVGEWSERMNDHSKPKLSFEEYRDLDPTAVLIVRDPDGKRRGLGVVGKGGGNLYRGDNLTDLESFAKGFKERGVIPADEGGTDAAQVLKGLERATPLLAELQDAADRKGARYPYAMNVGKLFEVPLPQIHPPISVMQVLRLRAVALMAGGDAEGAARDIRLILRLGRATEADPYLISKLVSMSCTGMALAAFWECNAIGTWNDQQLGKLRRDFALCQPIEQLIIGLRADRGILNEWMARPPSRLELVRIMKMMNGMSDKGAGEVVSPWQFSVIPRGLLLNDQAESNLFVQPFIDALKKRDAAAVLKLQEVSPRKVSLLNPIANMSSSDLRQMLIKAVAIQSHLAMADVACALEEYRLRHGRFPDSLQELVPLDLPSAVVEQLPGYPVRYQRIGDDSYQLACRAVPGMSKRERPPTDDWIWNRKPVN